MAAVPALLLLAGLAHAQEQAEEAAPTVQETAPDPPPEAPSVAEPRSEPAPALEPARDEPRATTAPPHSGSGDSPGRPDGPGDRPRRDRRYAQESCLPGSCPWDLAASLPDEPRLARGMRLDAIQYASPGAALIPAALGLPEPKPGMAWVRVGDDAALVDLATGTVIAVSYGILG